MLPEAVGHQTEPHGVVNMRWQDPRGEPIIIKRAKKESTGYGLCAHLVHLFPHTRGHTDQVVVSKTLEQRQPPHKLERTRSRRMSHHKLHTRTHTFAESGRAACELPWLGCVCEGAVRAWSWHVLNDLTRSSVDL